MTQLQAQCDSEREKSRGLQQELSQLVAQNRESREQAKHYEAAITELSMRVASDEEVKCPAAVERLIAVSGGLRVSMVNVILQKCCRVPWSCAIMINY